MGVKTGQRWNLFATAAPPLLLTAILYSLQHESNDVLPSRLPALFKRQDEEAQCPVDFTSPDVCSQITEFCPDFDDGLVSYLRLYACTPRPARPLILVLLVLWLPVLFGSMATAAADFLAVHLEYIVATVGISQNLAGVTLFAFGNGCTDLFATLAAMGANSGSLAISELFGAAAFITTVVLACIALIQPFRVDPRSFVGDLLWFVVAASMLIAFLADGQLVLGECLGIIGLYIAFVVFAVLRPQRAGFPTAETTTGLISEPYEDDAASEETENDGLQDAHADSSDHHPDILTQHSHPIDQEVEVELHSSVHSGNCSMNDHQFEDAPTAIDPLLDDQELDDLDLPPTATTSTTRPIALSTGALNRPNTFSRNFPPIETWHEQGISQRVLTTLSLPLLFPIGLTIPPRSPSVENESSSGELRLQTNATPAPGTLAFWLNNVREAIRGSMHIRLPRKQQLVQNWMLCLQLILGPQLGLLVVIIQGLSDPTVSTTLIACSIVLSGSVVLLVYVLSAHCPLNQTTQDNLPTSIVAFAVSLVWIYLIATSAVTLLMTLALILDIPTALLGATVFAVGQSSNDLVANTAVARRGMPVLAASATFGGPMMNMFLGIGGGGLVQVLKLKTAGGAGVYTFEPAAGLFVSATNLLLGLVVTLSYVFWNAWQLDRRLGLVLMGMWVSFTIVNVVVSMTA